MNSNHRSTNLLLTGIFLFVLVVGSFFIVSCEEDRPEEQSPTAEIVTEDIDETVAGEHMNIDKGVYSPGEAIIVTYVNDASFGDSPWIGMIPSEVPHGDGVVNDENDLKFEWLYGEPGDENSYTTYAPATPGSYDFRLSGGGIEIDSISFTVR